MKEMKEIEISSPVDFKKYKFLYGVAKDVFVEKDFVVVIEQTADSVLSITNCIEELATYIAQNDSSLKDVPLFSIKWFEHYPESQRNWIYNFSQVSFDLYDQGTEKNYFSNWLRKILKFNEKERILIFPSWLPVSKCEIETLQHRFKLQK